MAKRISPTEKPITHQRARRGNAEDAELMRRTILTTAYTLFQEGGVDAISMRELATRIGISAMTPYRYFRNKAEILTGLWESVIGELVAQQRRAVATQITPRDRLRASLEVYLKYWEKHPENYQLVYMPDLKAHEKFKVARSNVFTQNELRIFSRSLTQDYARAIGANPQNVNRATQIQHFIALGFLHNSLVSTDRSKKDNFLQSDVIEQCVLACERVLLGQGLR